MAENEGLAAFEYAICRSLRGTFSKNTVYKGIPIRKYDFNFGDVSNPNETCYCFTNDTCLRKGTIDLTKCLGVPLVATLPHFYNTDRWYLNQVRGLRPRSQEHGVPVYFEPVSNSLKVR